MILDTTFVVDILRGNPSAIRKLHTLLADGETLIITAPTIFEVFSGLAKSRKLPQERERIRRALNQHVQWAFDGKSAEAAGELDAELIAKGQTIGPIDSQIAGIALTNHEPVLTRNTEHFKRVPGLHVETY